MARGVTFGELITQLRTAARYDPNPQMSQNVLPLMQQTLRDTQERLYDEFDWPFLRITRDKILSAGQRYYDIPADLNLERIIKVDVRHGDQWHPVERGIDVEHYNAMDSDADERGDIITRWEVKDTGDGEQIEVWPIPDADGEALRFTGIRKLKPLTETADRADLDSQLIVLFAAGEMLAGAKNPEAEIKFKQGARRKEILQGRVTKRRTNSFVLGGEAPAAPAPRTPQVAYVRAP